MSSTRKFLYALAVVAAGMVADPHPAAADYPIFFQRYTADPGTLEWNGRLYLYASHDLDDQTSYQMFDITCISTDDLKNWTDHGECFNARTGSSWAQFSWAPTVVARNNQFYMYYGNNATGIGVAVASSPSGPFVDTRGRALIDARTPGVNPPSGMWIFDPSAFVDDDGRAYLYFGGNGPSNIRVIQLGADMVSTVGSAISLSAPRFFEAAWMHKNNGRYYLSYSTNWDNGAPTIDYMMSSSPTSGFQFAGTVLPQPPENSNNNHAGIFKYQNNWYVAYHNRTLARLNGVDPGFRRNLALDRLSYNADGTIQRVTITTGGVPQLKNLNPYNVVEAETMNRGQGIETEPCTEGGRDVGFIENGDWTRVVGVGFGAGATGFEARVASATGGGNIQLRLGSATGTLVGTCAVPGTGGWQTWTTVSCNVSGATGVQDLYLVFTGGSGFLFNVNWWRFRTAGAAAGVEADVP
jgi:arabinoxylan arabinofuranohydrolase